MSHCSVGSFVKRSLIIAAQTPNARLSRKLARLAAIIKKVISSLSLPEREGELFRNAQTTHSGDKEQTSRRNGHLMNQRALVEQEVPATRANSLPATVVGRGIDGYLVCANLPDRSNQLRIRIRFVRTSLFGFGRQKDDRYLCDLAGWQRCLCWRCSAAGRADPSCLRESRSYELQDETTLFRS